MDNISVPSRFACLKIEDDENPSVSSNDDKNTKKIDKNVKKAVSKKPNSPNTSSFKQILSNTKSNKSIEKQWEEWKKKDRKMVNDHFKQDMEDAMFQSKLEYEAFKNREIPELDDNKRYSIFNKKKKTKTMSLDQFLEGPEKQQLTDAEKEEIKEDFFDKMLEVARKEVTKGCVEEERKEREVNIEKIISMSQIQEKLKKEMAKNIELQKKLDDIKAEVRAVKARNKTLCSILGQGEMRDKAEILMELEQLNVINDELTEEVSNLHKLVEQERSKNASVDSKKDKTKK